MTPLRVVVVEDSPTQRAVLVRVLQSGGEITVVGEAENTAAAIEVVGRTRPDIVTMDLEIPGGGGLEAISKIMSTVPVPILVLSHQVADRGGRAAAGALSAGAAAVMPKPGVWSKADGVALRHRLGLIAAIPMVRRRETSLTAQQQRTTREASARRPAARRHGSPVIALGASTGGPQALAIVLRGLIGVPAPVLCVQHIHATFSAGLASWLQETSGARVRVVAHGEALEPGVVHVPPPHQHLIVGPDGRAALALEPVTIHRPSVDELFNSVARASGGSARAALLTGMGDDGARGLLAIAEAGGHTIAQDRETCVVYGMPGAAEKLGAAQQILPIDEIAPALLSTFSRVAA